MAGLELTREDKEKFLERTTDMLFQGILNRMDILAVLEIYRNACKREAEKVQAEMEAEIGPVSSVIQ